MMPNARPRIMTKREVGSLAFKLAGIYVLVQAATSLFTTGFLLTGEFRHALGLANLNWRIIILVGSAPTLILSALGIILIRWSDGLARWTFVDADELATATVTATDLQSALLTVVGVAMIATSLPDFARMATYFGTPAESMQRSMLALIGQHGSELTQLCAAVLVGVALIIGRRGAVDGWLKVRRAWLTLRGREDVANEDSHDGRPREV